MACPACMLDCAVFSRNDAKAYRMTLTSKFLEQGRKAGNVDTQLNGIIFNLNGNLIYSIKTEILIHLYS